MCTYEKALSMDTPNQIKYAIALRKPEKLPDNGILEMTSSMSIAAPVTAPAKKKKQKVDTPYKGSWADTMKTTDWKKPQPKEMGVKLIQSAEMIGNLLDESENLEKNNFEVPERRYRRDIEVGDKVKGIMGVHGHSSGTVTKIGSPYSSSGSPTIYVKSDDGKEWDTFGFNLSLQESKLHECDHGDIVRLTGYLKRPGYYKVDTQNAVGASQERPWVEDLSDPGTGFYIDPSDTEDMELVISSEEHDTRMINTLDDVENILEFGDVEYDD
jgi:hypothetical protein